MDILDIDEKPVFDDTVTRNEIHAYNPYVNSFNYGDEIRIPIHQQDINVLPSESYIHIEAQVVLKEDESKAAEGKDCVLGGNFGVSLFDEIRYELNGTEIDKCRYPVISTTLKNYISYNRNESKSLAVAGWTGGEILQIVDWNYSYQLSIPLKMIFGFSEDYKKVLINSRHELVLIRSRDDTNSIIKKEGGRDVKIKILKIQWRVPHITVSDKQKLHLMKIINTDKMISIPFRCWELHEYPSLAKATDHSWTVKTSSQLEKPRFVILAFQTNRKDIATGNSCIYDHCKLIKAKLFLNSEMYPYDEINTNFDRLKYAQLYDMYTNFQMAYYQRRSEPMLTYNEYRTKAPIIVFDASRQNDSLKMGPVDLRLEFTFKEAPKEKTIAYCLIIHERIVEYSALTSTVKVLI